MRDIAESRCDLSEAWDWFCEWTGCAADTEASMDPRIAQVIAALQAAPADNASAEHWARTLDLSLSRFLHLFTESTGVPFRRYRLWNRVRAAVDFGVQGRSFTDAALTSGFSDSAHFSRTFRDMLGVTPSEAMSNVSRVVRRVA